MPKRSIGDMVAAWAGIFKSIPEEQLEDLKSVEDLWSEPGGQFALPSREEIKTGSPQESSGGGAERMVREYSDPAPQMGMAQKYAEFQSMLSGFGKSQHELAGMVKAQGKAITAIATVLAAAADTTSKGKTPVTIDDSTYLGKAEIRLRTARAAFRKAEMSEDEEDEAEERKANLDAALEALKSAKRMLAKAADDDEGTDAEEKEERAEKALNALRKLNAAVQKALKADADREAAKAAVAQKAVEAAEATAATQKAEEAIAAQKAAEAAAAAAAATAAATAAKAEPVKEEDDKTEKSLTHAPIDPTLKGQLEVLQTTVKGLMDVVMAGSKNPPLPHFAKSVPVADLSTRIEAAIDGGELDSPNEIMKAHTLLTHVQAVQAGRMDAAVVDDEIAQASDNVRVLFQPVQAAA